MEEVQIDGKMYPASHVIAGKVEIEPGTFLYGTKDMDAKEALVEATKEQFADFEEKSKLGSLPIVVARLDRVKMLWRLGREDVQYIESDLPKDGQVWPMRDNLMATEVKAIAEVTAATMKIAAAGRKEWPKDAASRAAAAAVATAAAAAKDCAMSKGA